PVHVPRAIVPDHKGMLFIGTDAIDVRLAERNAAPEVERVPPLTVRLIVLEADKWKRAHVHFFLAAVGLQHWQDRVEVVGLGHLEKVTVLVALTGDVARESVQTIRPPEA